MARSLFAGWETDWKRRLYRSLRPSGHWNAQDAVSARPAAASFRDQEEDFLPINSNNGHGAVFNLEFSEDG